MGKAVKWLIGILLVLAVLIIAIPLILPLVIDPNDYRDTISRKVQEQTGRSLAIPGDIDLDFSLIGLNIVFKMGEVRLSSSPGFPETEFFSSSHAEINLALWPLITDKELKVSKIRIDGANVNLVKNEKGVSNWEDLAGEPQAGRPAEDEPTSKPAESGRGLTGIDIGGIEATDINVTYTDRQIGRTAKLSNLNVNIGHIRQGDPFPLQADFEIMLRDGEQEPISARINTSGMLTFSLPDQHFTLADFNLEGLIRNSTLPAGEMDFAVAADIDLKLQQQTADIKKLTINQGDMQIEAQLVMTGFSDPHVNGSLRIPPFPPRTQAEAFGIILPVEDPQSLAVMSLELEFAGNRAEMDFNKFHLNVDETNVNGTMSVKNIMRPAYYDLNLHIDQLDLDRYTAGKKEVPTAEVSSSEAPAPQSPAAPGQPEQTILPAEQLRELAFNAELDIDTLKAAKLTATNIKVKAGGRDGIIGLEPFAADFYDGTITITADIDARQETPAVKAVNDLKGVSLGPLFVDMTGREEFKGRADIHANITSRGATMDKLNRNANGTMDLTVSDGEIARLKIIDTIRTARALLGSKQQQETGSSEPAAAQQPAGQKVDSGRPTTFAALTATGVITNGVFKNDDLLAESELMRIEGKGTVDLVRERIDYLLTIFLAKTIDRDAETGLVELADTPIPYRVKGTFDKIEQSAALEEILKTEAKKLLFRELEKQFGKEEMQEDGTEKSPDPKKDLIDRGIKSIFGK
ncbi:MAG: AsmA family protein [Desulfobulbaceae bacterium]|nr:AsmA family protein [Desulfobulbaceae bacterium]